MFTHRNWMLMLPLLTSLVVGCGPEQAPVTGGEVSDSEVTTVEQVLSSGLAFSLVNRQSGMCVDIAASNPYNGAAAYQWSCEDRANQHFQLQPDGTGYYSFVAVHSGLCLDVAAALNQRGTVIYQWTCHGGDNQKFALVDLGTGFYNIVAKGGGTVSLPDGHYSSGGVVALDIGTGAAAEFRLKL